MSPRRYLLRGLRPGGGLSPPFSPSACASYTSISRPRSIRYSATPARGDAPISGARHGGASSTTSAFSSAVPAGHSMGVGSRNGPSTPRNVSGPAILICGAPVRPRHISRRLGHGQALSTSRQATERHRIDRGESAFRCWLMPIDRAYFVAQNTEPQQGGRPWRWGSPCPTLEHFASMPPKLFMNMLEDAAERRSTHFHARLDIPAARHSRRTRRLHPLLALAVTWRTLWGTRAMSSSSTEATPRPLDPR